LKRRNYQKANDGITTVGASCSSFSERKKKKKKKKKKEKKKKTKRRKKEKKRRKHKHIPTQVYTGCAHFCDACM